MSPTASRRRRRARGRTASLRPRGGPVGDAAPSRPMNARRRRADVDRTAAAARRTPPLRGRSPPARCRRRSRRDSRRANRRGARTAADGAVAVDDAGRGHSRHRSKPGSWNRSAGRDQRGRRATGPPAGRTPRARPRPARRCDICWTSSAGACRLPCSTCRARTRRPRPEVDALEPQPTRAAAGRRRPGRDARTRPARCLAAWAAIARGRLAVAPHGHGRVVVGRLLLGVVGAVGDGVGDLRTAGSRWREAGDVQIVTTHVQSSEAVTEGDV